MKSDLRDAVTAVKLSRAVIRNIRQNLFWAFFYNAIGIPLAAGVWYPAFGVKLNPMFGAAAMSLSSIFVVGNALRLKSFKSETRAQGTKSRTGKQQKEKQQTETAKAEKDSRQKTEKQERAEKTLKEKREKTGKQQKEQPKAGNEKQKKAEVVDIKTNKSKNRKSGQEREDKTMTKTMTIEGMMCAHCTGRVQKALEAVEGVKNVNVSLENKAAAVEFEGEVSDDALSAAVTEAGYEVKSIR
jgi:Cu+-exporting ATPase